MKSNRPTYVQIHFVEWSSPLEYLLPVAFVVPDLLIGQATGWLAAGGGLYQWDQYYYSSYSPALGTALWDRGAGMCKGKRNLIGERGLAGSVAFISMSRIPMKTRLVVDQRHCCMIHVLVAHVQ